MAVDATEFGNILLLSGEARSAFCTLGYALCSGEIDLTGKVPPNYIAALKRAYLDAYWPGKNDRFGLDSQGYPL